MATNQNEGVLTREQVKKEKQTKEKVRIRVRLIPIWLRIILVIVLFAISIVVGAIFGYSVMGDGKATDIFEKSTWTHIIDIVEKAK